MWGATVSDRLAEERNKWRRIATMLIQGAEQQIDDLGGLPKVPNPAWLRAWNMYDEAVQGE